MAGRQKDRVGAFAAGLRWLACVLAVSTPPVSMARADDGLTETDRPLADVIGAQIARCWNVPAGSAKTVQIAVSLNRDGSLDGKPRILLRQAGDPGDPIAASAVRALQRCAPFQLPEARYEDWKDMVLTFDPSSLE